MKRKVIGRTGLIAVSAVTAVISTMAITNSISMGTTEDAQTTTIREYDTYSNGIDLSADLTMPAEYLEEVAAEAYSEPVSSTMAKTRSVVADTWDNGALDYINANYTNLGIANVDTNLNVRSAPVSGTIIGKMFANGACEITEEVDGWYKITSGDVTGYVSGKYLLTGDEALERANKTIQLNVVVDVNALNFRNGASTSSKIKGVLRKNSVATLVEDLGSWKKISYNGQEGYVYGEHVVMQYNLPVAVTIDEYNSGRSGNSSGIRTQLVEYAKQFVGNPYVYGGNSLTKGTDCSGFVKLIMAKFGITTPRTATTQYNAGKKISVAELLPGDLIVYGDKVIEHIGIYIGDGQIVHASNRKTGIKYSDYNYRKIYGCVRFIED
ncbi:MAG: C40 family peptidase [Lachnospiraceae bacterium]|nr:C40 family peptidase [Lachnospiraceae bacterium]